MSVRDKMTNPEYCRAYIEEWLSEEFLMLVEEEMERRGLSEGMLSEKADVQLSPYFRRTRPLTFESAAIICCALGVEANITLVLPNSQSG